jgi:hypothetical protein
VVTAAPGTASPSLRPRKRLLRCAGFPRPRGGRPASGGCSQGFSSLTTLGVMAGRPAPPIPTSLMSPSPAHSTNRGDHVPISNRPESCPGHNPSSPSNQVSERLASGGSQASLQLRSRAGGRRSERIQSPPVTGGRAVRHCFFAAGTRRARDDGSRQR